MDLLKEGITQGFVIQTNQTKKISVDGITETLPVYKVKLDFLFFNDQNDRIATWISKYKTENKISAFNIEDRGNYNNVIQEFIEESNPAAMKKTQANIKQFNQLEAGVVLKDGRIIDGNRRFSCLRNLSKNDVKFGYFETVILDKDLVKSTKYIKMLELLLQHGIEAKVDYNPIDRLVGIYNDIIENELLTIKEYTESSGISENELKRQIEVAKLMVEFLEFIEKPKCFHIARDLELSGPLEELQKIIKKMSDEHQIENIKLIAFAQLLAKPEGDITRYVRNKIGNIAKSDYIDEFIEEQLNLVEEVVEKINDFEKTPETISEVKVVEKIRNDLEIKEKLEKSVIKYDEKVKITSIREQPLSILKKIIEQIEVIDLNIFSKLTDTQKSEINEQTKILISKVNKIEEELFN